MRIRKAAKILLGSSTIPHFTPSPSPPPPIDANDACLLSQSPWDLPLSEETQYLHMPTFQEEKHDDEGIFESIASMANEEEEEDDIKRHIDREKCSERRKRKAKKKVPNKEAASSAVVATVGICKKTDGKSWRCKIPVQPPYSFCSHHLAQVRSYNTPHGATSYKARGCHKYKMASRTAAKEDGGSGNYYYYSGFGPSCGKRRRDRGGGASSVGVTVSTVTKDNHKGEHSDGDEANVIGSTSSGATTEEEGSEEIKNKEIELIGWKSSNVRRKRRRKPIKARSLKSLL